MDKKKLNNFKCKYCGIKIKTIKTLEKHLRREHNGISERERNVQVKEFISLFPQEKKKEIIPAQNRSKKIKKEKKYFDKTESSINPIYTPMGNKR